MGMFFCQEKNGGSACQTFYVKRKEEIYWPLGALGQDAGSKTTWELKQKDLRKESRRSAVEVGETKVKSGECEKDNLPVGGKSEEAVDLKKYFKML
jgi:hypothetical protein